MIVSKVSGKPLGEFLQESIFGPLHMIRTHQGYSAHETNVALGYTAQNNLINRAYAWNLKWLAGPGGLTSTVVDLEKWNQAVRRPGIFTQASLNQMFVPSPINNNGSAYACGWVVTTLNGHKYVWHNGEIGGFHTMNATFPDDDIQIIILTNSDIPKYAPEQLVGPLFGQALLWHPLEFEPKTTRKRYKYAGGSI